MIVAQVLLSVAAILWLDFRRPTSAADLTLWLAAAVALLIAVRLAGIWIWPPLWVPRC
jgi:membrane-bound metal-dependent hydrolase YbcI (DUF457 family)